MVAAVACSVICTVIWSGKAIAQEQPDYVPGEYIIKIRGQVFSSAARQISDRLRSGPVRIAQSFSDLNLHRLKTDSSADAENLLRDLQSDPNVEYVERNYILRLDPVSVESTDVSYQEFLAQSNSAQNYSQNGAAIKATEAWAVSSSLTSDGHRPIVAVVDTGVDYTHSAFVNTDAIWINTGEIPDNNVDDDGNGYVDDIRGWNFAAKNNNPIDDDKTGHGTHVAGIVLGTTQSLASTEKSKIQIMPLKFLSSDGGGSTSDAIAAIYYAVRNGASVINNSWGGSNYSQSLHEALAYAYSQRVVIIAAAGNYSRDNDSTPIYPANYPVPSLISVAASYDWDQVASFSNYGKTTVHLASPGVSIYSTVKNGSFNYMSGTSMAAPLVAGLAALILREAPNLSGYQVKQLLLATSDGYTSLAKYTSSGSRVNMYKSVVSAKAEASTAASQPDYDANQVNSSSAGREPASTTQTGCGTVASSMLYGSQSGTSGPMTGLVLISLMMPIGLIVWFRRRELRKSGANRRQHERFVMNSDVRVNVNGREINGQLKTISVGGVSFKVEEMLEKGGVVELTIKGPDGQEQIQAQGHIVWSESNQAYGVKFDEAKEGVISSIRKWSSQLVKAN